MQLPYGGVAVIYRPTVSVLIRLEWHGLLAIESQTTGPHLQSFICALRWVRQGISKFSNTALPLQDFFYGVNTRLGKRSKRTVTSDNFHNCGRGFTKENAFD